MQPENRHSTDVHRAVTEHPGFPPLDLETRSTVTTEQAAFYLNRKPQTLRIWACKETYPPELRPVRVRGILGWPVAGIKTVLKGG